jgi:hypothetical protein
MYAVKRGWVGEVHPIGENLEYLDFSQQKSTTTKYFANQLIFKIFTYFLIIVLIGFSILLFFDKNFILSNILTNDVTLKNQEKANWEEIGQLYEPLESMAFVTDGENIYIIGGETPFGVTNKIEIYNINTNSVKLGKEKPTAVAEACGVLIGGKIYVGGGKKQDGTFSTKFEAYDIFMDKWEKLKDLPVSLAGYSCIVNEGKLYYIGGWDGQMVYKNIYMYNPESNSWTTIGLLSKARVYSGAILINNQVFIIGGLEDGKGVNSVEIFKMTGNEFVSDSELSLNTARYKLGSINILDKLYIIGGKSDDDFINYSLEYSPKNKIWRSFQNPLESEWSSLGVVSIGEYIVAFGGSLNNSITDKVYRMKVLYTIVLPVVHQ